MTFLIFILFVSNLLTCVSASNSSMDPEQATNAILEAENASHVAFSTMLNADKEGANVFIILESFNHGLSLTDQAQLQKNNGNYLDAYHLAKNATKIFNDIVPKASQLREQAIQNASQQEFLIMLMVPIVVIIITVTFYVCLKLWKKLKLIGFLRSRVEEAEHS